MNAFWLSIYLACTWCTQKVHSITSEPSHIRTNLNAEPIWHRRCAALPAARISESRQINMSIRQRLELGKMTTKKQQTYLHLFGQRAAYTHFIFFLSEITIIYLFRESHSSFIIRRVAFGVCDDDKQTEQHVRWTTNNTIDECDIDRIVSRALFVWCRPTSSPNSQNQCAQWIFPQQFVIALSVSAADYRLGSWLTRINDYYAHDECFSRIGKQSQYSKLVCAAKDNGILNDWMND